MLVEGGEELHLRHTETSVEVRCVEAYRWFDGLRETTIDRWQLRYRPPYSVVSLDGDKLAVRTRY